SQLKTGHPVRSAIHKQLNGRLVLRWVTTWESLLLYVLLFGHLNFGHCLYYPFCLCELRPVWLVAAICALMDYVPSFLTSV
ncbi:hypothetical protein KCU67_g15393, partial [Aureobasidium melanogenum]